jgi:hypothetical protein
MEPTAFDPLTYPLDPGWFDRPDSIHGLSHTRRVLIHATEIAAARDLDPDWFDSLVLAVAWHDIGRTHDGREPEHEPRSAAKVLQLGLGDGVERSRLIRALFAVEWHSVPDALAVERAAALARGGFKPEVGTMLRVLWVLKDADALDRVRINDLDVNQLRYPCSQARVEEAWRLLSEIP